MRPSSTEIFAPEFPPDTKWLNAPFIRLGTLFGTNAVLVWFWDIGSLNSVRALPYLQEWQDRYGETGLRVIGVHSPQFDFGHDPDTVARAVEWLEIGFPVGLDSDFQIWRAYGAEVWPSLYLWNRRGVLSHYHFAEGAYRETEVAIQEALLDIEPGLSLPEPMPPLRATDAPEALVTPPTPHTYLEEDRSAREVSTGDRLSVRYTGAGAAAVLDGSGHVEVCIDGQQVAVLKLSGPGLYDLYESSRSEQHEVTLEFLAPARAYMLSFAPGPA